MLGFLTVVFYIILFFYCLRLLSPIIARFFLKRWMNKIHRDLEERQSANDDLNNEDYTKYQSGDTEVIYKKNKPFKDKNQSSKFDDEYVEFEDLDNE